MPNPAARSTGVTIIDSDDGVVTAYPLFSQQKMTGSFHDRCEVDRLEQHALVKGAVAEECDRDPGLARRGRGGRGAERERRAAADHSIGAVDAERDVGDVHGAATAVVQSRLATEELGEHPAPDPPPARSGARGRGAST